MASPSDQRVQELLALCQEVLAGRPLLVASNRGPLEYLLPPEGQPQPRRGSGGIVTALNLLTQHLEFVWVANALGEGDRKASEQGGGKRIRSPLPPQRTSIRYLVTNRRAYHKFYNIICNPLLWFLQHYMWSPPHTPNVDAVVHDAWETGYVPINEAFAQALAEEAEEAAAPPLVYIHDYHLYLVGGLSGSFPRPGWTGAP